MNSFMSSSFGEKDKDGFACGTTACLAGWVIYTRYGINSEAKLNAFIQGINAARVPRHLNDSWLDFLYDTAAETERDRVLLQNLFGVGSSMVVHNATSKRAIAVLRNLADTGEIAWDAFDDEGKRIHTTTDAAEVPAT